MKTTSIWLEPSHIKPRFYGLCIVMGIVYIAGILLLYFNGDISTTKQISQWSVSLQFHHSLKLISAYTMYPFYCLFGFILIYATMKRLAWQRRVALGWLLAELSSSLCITILKMLAGRGRPHHMWHTGLIDQWIGPTLNSSFHSFPSGHTLDLWISATFFMLLIRPPLLCCIAWILAGLVAFSRIALTMHYLGDVLAGSFFAILFTALTIHYWLNRDKTLI